MSDLDVHLQAVVNGDKAVFGRWVAGAEATLRGSLRSFAASVDVEAVLQETLLRIWQVAGRVQPDGKSNGLLRFALRAGRNLALSEARRRSVPGVRAGPTAPSASTRPGPTSTRLVGPRPTRRRGCSGGWRRRSTRRGCREPRGRCWGGSELNQGSPNARGRPSGPGALGMLVTPRPRPKSNVHARSRGGERRSGSEGCGGDLAS